MTEAAPSREELAQMAAVHPTAWAIYLSRYAGDGTWANAAHFDLLADRVLRMYAESERILAGGKPSMEPGAQRLCVSLPPGSGKSEFLSLAVASWWLGTRPKSRVVIASYGRDLCLNWSQRARDSMAALGPEVFGVGALEREKAQLWRPRNPRGGKLLGPGYFYAVGRGGALTGKRAELLIVDDLIKDDMEASSPSIREHAWRWFDSVAMTRLLPHSCVIQIATRWHRGDPIGRLEDKQAAGECEKPWEFVNLPALAGEDDPMGRAPGEPLWPQMWDKEAVEAIRRGRDPRTWAALYQGRPTPEGGGLFKEAWVREYRVDGKRLLAPGLEVELHRLKRFSTVDLAGSKKERADWTVIATWGIDHESRTLWLLDLVRKRLEAPEIVPAMRDVLKRWEPVSFYAEETGPQLNYVHALKLAAAAGEQIDPNAPAKKRDLVLGLAVEAGVPVRKVKPVGDKVTRSGQAQAVMQAGRLLIPAKADWRPVYLDELLSFPEANHDDQVDATSYAARVFLETLAAAEALRQRQRYDDGPDLVQGIDPTR